MGCCGGQSGRLAAAKNIVAGYVSYNAYRVFRLSGKKTEAADSRVETCQMCEWQTWLTKAAYLAWLAANGVEVFRNLDDLSRLPMLEKHDSGAGRSLFCRECKCWIPAKAYSKDSRCPKDKWNI